MELGMRLRCCHQLPPNANQPPPPPSSATGGRPCTPRRARALQLQVAAAPDSRPLETICGGNNILGPGTKLSTADKFFQVEMAVRDCDLDQHGVVHSAVYADYIDKAREELASSLGIDRGSIARTGNAMALSELNLKYFSPLKRGARFVVMVRVVQMKGVRMIVQHVVETLPERKLVLEATGTVICLNKDYRPTRVFPEVASRLLHFFASPI